MFNKLASYGANISIFSGFFFLYVILEAFLQSKIRNKTQ
jgi:hypothetical protein